MLRTLLRNTILFLRSPIGTAALTYTVSLALFSLQPQPWTLPVRLLLALLPAGIPATLAALAVQRRGHLTSAVRRLWIGAVALLLWLVLLFDIGQPFLPWILVFSLSLIFSFVAGLRYASLLSLGMVFFALLYGSLRLHQAEQFLYLNLLVKLEQRSSEIQFTTEEAAGHIKIFENGAREPLITVPVPEPMKRLTDPESDGFFGLQPAFVVTLDPTDTHAIPMAAVLLVPEDFPAKLWNIQVSNSLEDIRRQGGATAAEQVERQGTCGPLPCTETIWLYEDRFQAIPIQTGYALLSIPMVGPLAGSRTVMIWFREPVVEGFPHHPLIIEILKGLSFTASAAKAD